MTIVHSMITAFALILFSPSASPGVPVAVTTVDFAFGPQVAGRKGSTRVGGVGPSGKGSRYIGGRQAKKKK